MMLVLISLIIFSNPNQLTHYMLKLPSHRNQSTDLLCKSIDWCLSLATLAFNRLIRKLHTNYQFKVTTNDTTQKSACKSVIMPFPFHFNSRENSQFLSAINYFCKILYRNSIDWLL